MDWTQLASTALGGVLAIAGGFGAVLVADWRQRSHAEADRLRELRLQMLEDTREHCLSLLDWGFGLAAGDNSLAERSGYMGSPTRRRVDLSYLGSVKLLHEYYEVGDALLSIGANEDGMALTDPLIRGYHALRNRLAKAFVEQEQRIIAGTEPIVLSSQDVIDATEQSPYIREFNRHYPAA